MLAAVVLAVTLPAGAVSAETETVETPVGTYHVETDQGVSAPVVELHRICINRTCTAFPAPHVHDIGGGHVAANVWEETNGCPGLQRESGDRDEGGIGEPADEQAFAVDERI